MAVAAVPSQPGAFYWTVGHSIWSVNLAQGRTAAACLCVHCRASAPPGCGQSSVLAPNYFAAAPSPPPPPRLSPSPPPPPSPPPAPPGCASIFGVTAASFSNTTHLIDYTIQPGAAKVFILREAKKNFANALNDCKAIKLPTQAAYSTGTLVHYNTGAKKHRAVEAALVLSRGSDFSYWIGLAIPTLGAAGSTWSKTGFSWLNGGTPPSSIPSGRNYEGGDYR